LLYQLALAMITSWSWHYITWRGVVNKHSISRNHVSCWCIWYDI